MQSKFSIKGQGSRVKYLGIMLELLIFTFLLLTLPNHVFAAGNQYITIVNPIRGADFFTGSGQPVDNVNREYVEIKKRNLSSTWLIRPDALFNENVVRLLKSVPTNEEIGLFMEVTPTWTNLAGVKYRPGLTWHSAGSLFLTGYEVSERQKLIDSAFEKFKTTFGYYPKSVGAWWIDAGSLSYMKEKYNIVTSMDVADQFSTDNYSIWGQYFSTPFLPAKRNALVPGSGEQQEIGVVTIQWASRDPFNAYGNGVLDSTYSVQANDYGNPKYHNLGTDYFKKLLAIYLDNPLSSVKQVTVGLENDFNWNDFGAEYTRQLDEVASRQRTGIQVLTMSQFASSYNNTYSLTPPQIILADDPLGSGGKVLWYQNTNYRVGWFFNSQGSVISDLRLFRESVDEPCLSKACANLNLAETQTRNLDAVTYGDSWVVDEGKISDVRVSPITDGVQIDYKNSAGVLRTIKFVKNDVIIDKAPLPIATAIGLAIKNSENIQKIKSDFSYQLKDGLKKVLFEQVKGLAIFTLFAILFFYLPGLLLLRKTPISDNAKFVLSWPVGLATFTLFAFIVGFFNFWWLLVFLPLVSVFVVKKDFIVPKIIFTKELAIGSLIIFLGSLSWLATMVKSGLDYDFGLGFWGANGHDGLWHLSLIESLKNGLPPQNPIFAGVNLSNYHYFFDLCLAAISNLTSLSANDLYFRFFPIFLCISIGLVSYLIAVYWFISKLAGVLAVFFIYFGGSFGWVVSFIKDRSLGGETLFWAQQGISTLINPPFASSILILLAGLYLFKQLIEQKLYNYKLLIPLIILWGTLIEFKVYAGILVLGALALVTLLEMFKRNLEILKMSLPIAILSGLVFLPNNLAGSSLLVFSPFWLIHSMVTAADRLNWARLSLVRTAGLESRNWFKFFGAEILGLIIFVLGNLGTRVIGGIGVIREIREINKNSFSWFVLAFLSLALILPLLFIQKGGAFNIVQFCYYFLLIFNFLAAGVLARFVKRFGKLGWVMIAVIVVLTSPTTWDTLGQYLPSRPPSRIPTEEVEALNFLKNQPKGVVLSYYFDDKQRLKYEEPLPLFAYTSTPYVGAYTGKSEYIADTINLEILGIDYKGRLQTQKDIFSEREPEQIKKRLHEENISYIYAVKPSGFSVNEETFGVKKIFGNDEVAIYKVL